MEEKNIEEKNINAEQGAVQENESNAAKRLRLLGDNNEDKIHSTEMAITKGNFFSNLWYQHKWGIIIGSVLVIIAVIFIISMVTKPKYDMYVSYTGPLYPDYETHDAIEKAFFELAQDYDGNGEKMLNFAAITYQNDEQRKQTAEEMMDGYGAILQTSENYKALTTIQSQMLSGSVAIYLMDETLFKSYEADMVKISELTEGKLDKSVLASDSGVYFKKTAYYKHAQKTEWGASLKNLPDDTVLCILPKLITIDEELYQSSLLLIKAILEFGLEK